MEKEKYMKMGFGFISLLIALYEEIRGFKEEELQTELKEGAKPVWQRLRRLGQEYMATLKEEVDKLLKVGFIYPVENVEWVSPMVVAP